MQTSRRPTQTLMNRLQMGSTGSTVPKDQSKFLTLLSETSQTKRNSSPHVPMQHIPVKYIAETHCIKNNFQTLPFIASKSSTLPGNKE